MRRGKHCPVPRVSSAQPVINHITTRKHRSGDTLPRAPQSITWSSTRLENTTVRDTFPRATNDNHFGAHPERIRGEGGPRPCKISHEKDGRQKWPHRFHVSWPPLTRPLDPLLSYNVTLAIIILPDS